jgi:C1A family cysteine protease
LLDYRTNKKVYILDITNADNWSINEGVGKRTIKVVDFTVDGDSYEGIINEAALDETETFHSFLWKTVSGAIKYQISGLTFFEAPTVNSLSAEIVDSDVTLNGFILDENGKPVTEKGFEYGPNDNPDTWTDSITGEGEFSFDALLSDLEDGTYYYRAYAVNEIGTGYGEVISFTIESSIIGYIGTTPLVKIYIGNTEITSLQL